MVSAFSSVGKAVGFPHRAGVDSLRAHVGESLTSFYNQRNYDMPPVRFGTCQQGKHKTE